MILDRLNQIWTIARHSIVQAIRMKLVLIIIVFLVVLVPVLPFLLKSDNSHIGQIKIVITYSVHLISLLLSVLTLFLSAITLNSEIKNQQIFLLDPKPVPRSVVLLGKLTGIMAINILLLLIMMGTTTVLVRYLARQRPGESLASHKIVQNGILLSKQTVIPLPPKNLAELAREEFKYLKEKKLLPEDKSDEWNYSQLLQRYHRGAWYVPAHGTVTWTLTGIPKLKEDQYLTISFKHLGQTSSQRVTVLGEFVINEDGDVVSRLSDDFLVNKTHTFAVPASTIKPDGSITIRYSNLDDSNDVTFSFGDGIVAYYPVGTLETNMLAATLIILTKLSFIAIVGIAASTFCSFPVAILATMLVFLVGHLSNFIITDLVKDVFLFQSGDLPPWMPVNVGDATIKNILRFLVSIFPNFADADIVPGLADGYRLTVFDVLKTFWQLIVIRGSVVALAGWLIFRRRELAALTPNT